jgi:elongation factor P
MDTDTYEQFRLLKQRVGESAKFLQDGEQVQVMFYEGKPVSVELPNTMIFEVVSTPPGYKGNTVSNVYKDATLGNGAVVKVPSHIKKGEKVKIDTRSGEYVSKA